MNVLTHRTNDRGDGSPYRINPKMDSSWGHGHPLYRFVKGILSNSLLSSSSIPGLLFWFSSSPKLSFFFVALIIIRTPKYSFSASAFSESYGGLEERLLCLFPGPIKRKASTSQSCVPKVGCYLQGKPRKDHIQLCYTATRRCHKAQLGGSPENLTWSRWV